MDAPYWKVKESLDRCLAEYNAQEEVRRKSDAELPTLLDCMGILKPADASGGSVIKEADAAKD